jgi:hypothetical protein
MHSHHVRPDENAVYNAVFVIRLLLDAGRQSRFLESREAIRIRIARVAR